MNELQIGEGTVITLHFSLKLEDGSVIDSNFETEAATFTFADGSMLPGFEENLVGLVAGSEAQFKVPPEKGFGQANSNNILSVPRDSFGNEAPLEEGMVFNFKDARGYEIPGVVREIGEDEVMIDCNHPLAGRTIVFDVRILKVEPQVRH